MYLIFNINTQVTMSSKIDGDQASRDADNINPTVDQKEFQFPSQDVRLKKSGRNVAMMRRSDDGVLKQKVSIGNLKFQMI